MAEVRRPLIALISLYAGAITVDRLGERSIGWWVFVLAAVAIAMMLVRRRVGIRPLPFVFGALAAYLIAKTFLVEGFGFAGSDIYLTVTETAFVAMTVALSARLSSALGSLDDALGAVAFGENPAMPLEAPQATNEILTEMARSRRHERPLSVTIIAPERRSFEVAVEAVADEVQRAIRARYVRGSISRLIAGQLRRSDALYEDPRTGHFLVLSPETGEDGASLLLERVRRAGSAAGLELETGTASFPDHAVSFEQLVDLAERRLAGDSTLPPRLKAIRVETGAT